MTREEFEQLIEEEFPNAIPEKFRPHLRNVAFLVEDEPSPAVRTQEGLGPHETLLGLYQGIPYPARGDWYGMGSTMPDTITLYQRPIEHAAHEDGHEVRKVIRETIWHEVAHLFGMDEHTVRGRESLRDGRDAPHVRKHGPDEECESCSA
jgi:predicted Zn-dependent protease with MMP-like domain